MSSLDFVTAQEIRSVALGIRRRTRTLELRNANQLKSVAIFLLRFHSSIIDRRRAETRVIM